MKQSALQRKWWPIAILLVLCLSVKLFSLHSALVEKYYATGFYLIISHILRLLFGWLPFSIGDVLYAGAVIWLLVKGIRLVRLLIKKQFSRQTFFSGIYQLLRFVFCIYIVFNIFWGLNYDREGIAYQLLLQPQPVESNDLHALANSLLIKVNAARKALPATVVYAPYAINISHAVAAYGEAQTSYPFLHYQYPSIKSSLYNLLGNYFGFSGYYNPFTAEAQVNTDIPVFLVPYVTCHEMAHQLGYATEDEANFAGYLAAKSSRDLTFRYSVYFDLFGYANGELFLHDSMAAKANYKQLDTLVKTDFLTYRTYLKKYRNPLEPIITLLYGNYLKANNQPEGMDTYGKVVAWLIAYQKKYGQL